MAKLSSKQIVGSQVDERLISKTVGSSDLSYSTCEATTSGVLRVLNALAINKGSGVNPNRRIDITCGASDAFYAEGAGEQANVTLKRTGTVGTGVNPYFQMGRIQPSPVAEAQMSTFFEDDNSGGQKKVFSVESTGTFASITRGVRRSCFESFITDGDDEPVFRLNSYGHSGEMALEFGSGGLNTPATYDKSTDIMLQRNPSGHKIDIITGIYSSPNTTRYTRMALGSTGMDFYQNSTDPAPTSTSARFWDDGNTNYVGLKAPSTIASNFDLTLPSSAGSVGDSLTLTGATTFGFIAKANATHTHATTDITSGTFADARIAFSNVTQHVPIYLEVIAADQFITVSGSDWLVNAGATLQNDATNAALLVRAFDDTTDEGVGFWLDVPSNATSIIFKTRGRAATASTSVVKPLFAKRGIPDNGAVGAWASVALGDINIPNNTLFQTDSTTLTLAAAGLTAGALSQCQLIRDAGASDTLTGDFMLLSLTIAFV